MEKTLYYTVANHMHWTDVQWLWGYDALPSSTRDMLRLAEGLDSKGNVDFDAISYEKLAVEAPEAFAELRVAVQAGKLEIVGASYGQPYGLFHGGESNVRQFVFGVRAVQRLFGVRPRVFWQEEFAFFPQLPQILRGAGYSSAALCFQWTWHTPTVPEEALSLVMWEGLDGSKLPTLPKNELTLSPAPEDFDGRLESKLLKSLEKPALVHWVELIPEPDWTCKSALWLPKLKQLRADPRFELKPVTAGELIAELAKTPAPVRRYTLDDVFHGVSLGKNGDNMPRWSRACEEQLLAAESVAALAGLFGRPYAAWDVYPTWELDEAWREMLAAQHHANHTAEGRCGFVGLRSFERSLGLASEVFARTLEHLADRVRAEAGSQLVFNTLGWTRDVALEDGSIARAVPAWGYKVVDPEGDGEDPPEAVEIEEREGALVLARGDFEVEIDKKSGFVRQIWTREFPQGLLHARRPLGELEMVRDGRPERFRTASMSESDEDYAEVTFLREGRYGSRMRVSYHVAPLYDALGIHVECESLARPDAGMHSGLRTQIAPEFGDFTLVHDHPYGVSEIRADKNHLRKYPTGDPTTSKPWFEDVKRPFTALSFVDVLDASARGAGLLVVHDGGQGFFRTDHGVDALLSMYDAWDEEYFHDAFSADLWLVPHGALTNTERMRIALELTAGSPRFSDAAITTGEGELPPTFGAIQVECDHVLPTAFYRESRRGPEHLAHAFAVDVRDPYVLRLVEFDGRPATVSVLFPGPIAKAARTTPLGEIEELLEPELADAPYGPEGVPWSRVRLTMRPHEIATVMLDLELGRRIPRDLDPRQHDWATTPRGAKP
ncbi:MAG: hypothetical protein K8S98_17505 [Planctomycetes bacterium]|nr:hypothetical protein [Planctomycetota bacterium]